MLQYLIVIDNPGVPLVDTKRWLWPRAWKVEEPWWILFLEMRAVAITLVALGQGIRLLIIGGVCGKIKNGWNERVVSNISFGISMNLAWIIWSVEGQ
jgi:hypothetical protein